MKKAVHFLLFAAMIIFITNGSLYAQVSMYTFAQSSVTYTPITGGTVIAAADATTGAGSLDDVIYTLPDGTIPFDFYFNGSLFTGFKVSSNGFITFGDVSPTTTTYTPISSTLGYNGAVSPVGRDIQGVYGTTGDRTLGSPVLTNVTNFHGVEVGKFITGTGIPGTTAVPTVTIVSFDVGAGTITMSDNAISTGAATVVTIASGEIRYEVLGTAPNRIFVIQYKNFRKFSAATDNFNFQIRLHESSYKIDYIYGPFVSNATSTTIQVGLRGGANTDFINRTSLTDWTATTQGGTNTAAVTLTNLIFPPSGLMFEWISPNFPPIISYTVLNNTASIGSRILSNVTIEDPHGIATGALAPRIYWRVNAGAWQSAATSQTSSPYSFTIGTAGLSTGDVVEYYVVAQDLLGVVGANPSAGFTAVDVNNITTPPTTPNSYVIQPTISGTFNVGTGETYANLTAVAAAINSSVLSGNVVFELTNNYDGTTGETLPIVFGNVNSEPPGFTVTIRPASGVTNRVTSGDPGSNFAFPVINIVGGNDYTFDGRPGGIGTAIEWTIRNTRAIATIGCVVRFADGAVNNTIRNLNLESQATLTTTGVVFFHTSTATVGNSNNTVLNNNIRPRTDAAAPSISNGILSNGTATAPNTGNVIQGNHIVNFNNIAVSILATGNGPDWEIVDNHMYNPTLSSTVAQTGISIASATSLGTVISGNFIGGSGPNATGTMTNSGAGVIVTGILVSSGVAMIDDNTIANITQTGTGTAARLRGIYITSAFDGNQIIDNHIFNLSTMSTGVGLGAAVQPVWGIGVFTGSTWYITNVIGNMIHNISAENTFANATSNVPCGMFLTNVGEGSVIANNRIYDIKNKATGVTASQPPIAAGIFIRFLLNPGIVNNMISLGTGENTNTQFAGIMVVAGLSGNINNYLFNSIAITGTSGGTIGSFGVLRGDNTAVSIGSTVNLFNNAIYVDRSGGGSVNHAVGSQGTDATLNFNSNFNMLFNSDVNTLGLVNTTSYPFSSWKLAMASDGSSLSPSALNGSDLFAGIPTGNLSVLTANSISWLLNGNATQIPGVNFDYNGDPRSDNVEDGAPDIGAVEFIPTAQPPVITVPVTADGAEYDLEFAGKVFATVEVTTFGTMNQLNAQYFPGVDPPNAPPTTQNGNVHWDIYPNAGASGYVYNMTLHYTEPLLGTIDSEGNIRMAKSDNGGLDWTPYLVAGTGPGQYELDMVNNTIKVHGLTSLSLFAITDADAPLPVDLGSFTATVEGRNVLLQWTTLWEENSERFEIRRKIHGDENAIWQVVGSVNASGTVYEERHYSLIDRNLTTGKYDYKLVQYDYNGQSNADWDLNQAVEVGIPTKFDLAQNYPNPFNPTTKIMYEIPSASLVKILVYDMAGREVAVLVNEFLAPGYYTADFNGSSLSSGAYFYRLVTANSVITKKMMLVK